MPQGTGAPLLTWFDIKTEVIGKGVAGFGKTCCTGIGLGKAGCVNLLLWWMMRKFADNVDVTGGES